MITKVFSVFDTKLACYGTPFFMLTRGAAIRTFSDLSNDEKSSINKHPHDYCLFELGEFDDVKGEIIPCVPTSLGTANTFIVDLEVKK